MRIGFDSMMQKEIGEFLPSEKPCTLTLNGGSSSIRFSVYEIGESLELLLSGKIDRIGESGTSLSYSTKGEVKPKTVAADCHDHASCVNFLLDWLGARPVFARVRAVGHRVVHGMHHAEPELITQALMAELHSITEYDPDHLPHELKLIETMKKRHPDLFQVACFDTAFHRTMPPIAKTVPIPRKYAALGVERYGFHGLSYSYLTEELARIDLTASKGRVILAHLGNGASMAAVKNGVSIDTSMGFTPVSGLVMGTRAGDIDPGLGYFLARKENMTAAQFQRMINHESGLLGVSETSSDLRDLLAKESTDSRASEAVSLFCYQAKKYIGAYAAALGGLETLVFAGGIGENSAVIRERICDDLGFLGIKLSKPRNSANEGIISTEKSPVTVRIIRTDEEQMIARSVNRLLSLNKAS